MKTNRTEYYQYEKASLLKLLVIQHESIAWKSRIRSNLTFLEEHFILGFDFSFGIIAFYVENQLWDYFKDVTVIMTAPEKAIFDRDKIFKVIKELAIKKD